MTTGERIKAARKRAGVTQAQLAEQSGVAAISIHQYEAGKRNPQLEPVLHIANALGVPVQELVEDWSAMDPEDVKDAIVHGGPIGKVAENMKRLNLTGRERGLAYSADMVKIPEYRAPEPPQGTLAPSEGTDTTPPPDGPQRPPEGQE